MTDFNKILNKARELENKMKESQENIKKIRVEGFSGSNLVKVILDGEGELQKIEISDELLMSSVKKVHNFFLLNVCCTTKTFFYITKDVNSQRNKSSFIPKNLK